MSSALIQQAVALLRAGRLVAFPTETVYGLGADATDSAAVLRIFAAKGRPPTNPLIAHIAGVEQARRYARVWPPAADRLATRFWPGPLTIVLPKAPCIAAEVSAGLDTVGLRCPRHPLALELLAQFDGPIAAPSANRSNRVSPTTADHVRSELGNSVDLILDGGPCEVGIESTVIDLSTPVPTLLRPGRVSLEELRNCLGEVAVRNQILSDQIASAAPGQNAIHYSPQTPCFRFEACDRPRIAQFATPNAILILCGANGPAADLTSRQPLVMPADPNAFARHLYATLHAADRRNAPAIYLELPPNAPSWTAVRDRLFRAARPITVPA